MGCEDVDDDNSLDMFAKYDVLLPVVATFILDFGDQLDIEYDFFGTDSLNLLAIEASISQDGLYSTLDEGGDIGAAAEGDNDADTSLLDMFSK